MDPKTEPVSDSNNPIRDVLSGLNADEIVDDPSRTEDEGESDAPAANPDSPSPI